MQRLYYLTASLDSAEQISIDLHSQGISDWHFHVLSKDEAGLYKRHIHSANLIQKLDVVRYTERGAMIGFVGALAVTAYVLAIDPFGPDISGLVYVAIFGFITLFGAWVGGLTGLAKENQKVASYHDDIEAGKYLLLIDVRKHEEEKVRSLMAARHPEAEYRRTGSTVVNPFKPAPKLA
jgi:hypothetical protein